MESGGSIKFSILVPVYQVEKYIDECIQSVLNQTYTNWELILVDDGTKDQSGKICDRYAELYSNIYVYHKENKGQLHTRLYGVEKATGDYCIFLDSDDTLKTDALEVIYHIIQKYSCDCIIYGYQRVAEGRVLWETPKEVECCITDKRELYRKCFFGPYNEVWRKAVKRTVFRYTIQEYNPYFHLRIAEDLLQSIEILESSNSVVFIDDKLYNYRVNPNSIMQSIKYSENFEFDYTIMQRVLEFLEKQEAFPEEDLEEYRGYCLCMICSDIYRVSVYKSKYSNKKRIFKNIKASNYYQEVVKKPYSRKYIWRKEQVIFALFSKGYYGLTVLACFVYKALFERQK